jgi:hypothetical protein
MPTQETVERTDQQIADRMTKDLLVLTPLERNILLPFDQRLKQLLAEKEHVEQMIGAMHFGANAALALMISQRKLEGTYAPSADITRLIKQDPPADAPQPSK